MKLNSLHEDAKAIQKPRHSEQSPIPDGESHAPLNAPGAQLQRALGNQHLARMVDDSATQTGGIARATLQRLATQHGAGDTVLQTKLTLGPVGDPYEQEADAVAKQVVNTLASAPQTQSDQSVQRQGELEEEELQMKAERNNLQRQELPEEDELMAKRLSASVQRQELPEEEELMAKRIQRSSTVEGGDVSDDVETAIQRARGGGHALNESVRSPMEQAFGADFSNVSIHTGAESNQLNQSLQARAFTTGQDIFFGQGEFNPGSNTGKELLAHELTHVVQQNGSAVQREEQ